jgi:hypothetical protein
MVRKQSKTKNNTTSKQPQRQTTPQQTIPIQQAISNNVASQQKQISTPPQQQLTPYIQPNVRLPAIRRP